MTSLLLQAMPCLLPVHGVGTVLGLSMAALAVATFMHIRFVLFKRLDRAVAKSAWAAGGAVLTQIRTWLSINLGLGFLVLFVGPCRPFPRVVDGTDTVSRPGCPNERQHGGYSR